MVRKDGDKSGLRSFYDIRNVFNSHKAKMSAILIRRYKLINHTAFQITGRDSSVGIATR